MLKWLLPDTDRTRPSQSPSSIDDPNNDIYDILHVQKPDGSPFPIWKRLSWKWHSRLLPLLHFGQGEACPPDVFVNLRVLWNKALTSLDPNSTANEAADHYPTFHMLPRISRWFLFRSIIPLWMYPRWMHANIELRTVYLNQAMEKEIQQILQTGEASSLEIVVFGAGYDTRSIRTLWRYPQVTRSWELDLESVIRSKQKLVQRLFLQLPQLSWISDSLRFLGVDLNDLEQVELALENIAQERGTMGVHTIVVTEAVLMYLENDKPAKILQLCKEKLGPNVSWLLVDRLKEIPDATSDDDDDMSSSRQAATTYLASLGWQVVDWMIKPGATRHMGLVRPL